MKQSVKAKRIIFIRHGESFDDLFNEFGGWSNRGATPKSLKLAVKKAVELQKQYPNITMVYTSPLKRARQFAKVLASELKVSVETNVFLKERNTYGLLNGLNHNLARKKYPELVKLFDKQEYIPGSERYDDFVDRVGILLDWIKSTAQSGATVYVTQGYVMTTILEEYLERTRKSIDFGGYFVCEIKGTKFVLTKLSQVELGRPAKSDQILIKKFKKI